MAHFFKVAVGFSLLAFRCGLPASVHSPPTGGQGSDHGLANYREIMVRWTSTDGVIGVPPKNSKVSPPPLYW